MFSCLRIAPEKTSAALMVHSSPELATIRASGKATIITTRTKGAPQTRPLQLVKAYTDLGFRVYLSTTKAAEPAPAADALEAPSATKAGFERTQGALPYWFKL